VKKYPLVALVIITSGILFFISFLLTGQNNNVFKPGIDIKTLSTTSKVIWYTSIPQKDAESIANAFRTETSIDVEIVRASTFVIRDRVMSEITKGSTGADVLTIADIATYADLKSQGYLMEYDSPEYAQYSDKFKDPGYWAVFAGFGICMAYNENLIDSPPQHWTDLLNSRWQGRIGLEDISTAGSQYGQYYVLREMLGVGFWEKLLSTQKPKIYNSTTALADALVTGEIDIAGEFSIQTVFSYRIARGVSIQGTYPEEGIPFVVNPTAIMVQASHPREARIFQDFLLSRKGQEIMQNTSYKYSLRDGIASLGGIPAMDDLLILLPGDAELYGSKRDTCIQEFNSLLKANP
jgi:iron(III) transport system substrate-binding protein